jgi:hypothetical protein
MPRASRTLLDGGASLIGKARHRGDALGRLLREGEQANTDDGDAGREPAEHGSEAADGGQVLASPRDALEGAGARFLYLVEGLGNLLVASEDYVLNDVIDFARHHFILLL